MPDKIQYTQEQMRGDLHDITRQVNHSAFDPDVIVGVARGGLVPATMLSHYYDAPLVCLNISLRDDRVDRGHTGLDTLVRDIKDGKRILLVDDICDSGATLAKIVEMVTYAMEWHPDTLDLQDVMRVAVLWTNVGQDVFEPNYAAREINRAEDDRWIIFPYEEWWKS